MATVKKLQTPMSKGQLMFWQCRESPTSMWEDLDDDEKTKWENRANDYEEEVLYENSRVKEVEITFTFPADQYDTLLHPFQQQYFPLNTLDDVIYRALIEFMNIPKGMYHTDS